MKKTPKEKTEDRNKPVKVKSKIKSGTDDLWQWRKKSDIRPR
jgi:hypothetical protein